MPGFSTAHDRIYVYPRGAPDQSGDWRQALDMSNAVWLFDVGVEGRAELLIDFHPSGTDVVADVYDAQDGSGQVSYQLVNGIPTPAGSPAFPTVHVLAQGGWWLRDGRINYNLEINIDGPVDAQWGSPVYYKTFKTDGRTDFSIKVRDDQFSGHPNWELAQAFPQLPAEDAVLRTLLMVSPRGDIPFTGYLFWPLLAPAPWGQIQGYNQRQPPIQVDWVSGQVKTIGEFVASRGAPDDWFVYSNAAFGTNDNSSYADFENPFSFYDLAGKSDGYPDLTIRNEYAGPLDPFIEYGRLPQALDQIRYSWDQDHTHKRWTYKLDLVGRNLIDSEVTVGQTILRTVPYPEYPSWIFSHPWDVIAFVEDMAGVAGWTSEGMYESPLSSRTQQVVLGQDTKPITAADWRVDAGYRTDYRAEPGSHPRLYLSTIDHQLHLLAAQGGVWNMGSGNELKYVNLGGSYINRWEQMQNGTRREALSFLDGQLIHETAAGVSIKTVSAPDALFTSDPPKDHQSWTELGASLAANKAVYEASNVGAMFDQFSAPAQILKGAQLSDLRETQDGFSFAVALPPNASPAPPWQGLPAGQYLVRYRAGQGYLLSPLAPAALEVSSIEILGGAPTVLHPDELRVTVSNAGGVTDGNVTVAFMASANGDAPTEVGSQSLNLPAGDSKQVAMGWTPSRSGVWQISAAVTDSAGVAAAQDLTVQVAPSPSANIFSLLAATHLGLRLIGPGAALLGLILLAGSIAAACWSRPSEPDG